MSELPPAQFRKTKAGKWAVMAPVEALEGALKEDGRVDVLKKSGDWSKFTVASLGKPFDVEGVQMCYGYGPGDEDDGGGGSSSGPGRSAGPAPQPPPEDRPPAEATWADAPARDESEPVPEFRGEADDEWEEF